ncbi:hypothetical protein ABFS82_10G077900 [Erythranthe guttata]|uniref:Pectinesterase n=1 Tax=Erythranthe guttata TaxID=4155 RepID=A0A022QCX9_ERYGU|nr:PREDICTED: pectinesterase-like [Erythranthe guttata]EYU25806.1 hypothetical protein MIMGU_mgv1a003215mg [Erythranthe guttata]|eukprot:XP_012851165.1 PREDICTED: pectinesterase-like [Erythranthe guttata]
MESTSTIKKLTKTHTLIIKLVAFLAVAAVFISLFLINSSNHHRRRRPLPTTPPSPLQSFIKKSCSETLYPSLCHTTLSPLIPTSMNNNNSTTFQNILQFAINRTAGHVKNTQTRISANFKTQDLTSPEKNALKDCMEMLDQTLYELEQALIQLGGGSSPPPTTGYNLRRSYGNIKTLLSAAMTNENTCINGFSDLEELDLVGGGRNPQKGTHREHLQNLLTPISHMISNTLALIKRVENINRKRVHRIIKNTESKAVIDPNYVRIVRRRKKHAAAVKRRRNNIPRPDSIVAWDGSGDCTSIAKAIAKAPNMSAKTYTIKIKSGVYKESVLIPREKINIMLVGDGMNSTIITGSKNFVDGFSTFQSATLTVVGDKFLARDLTIRNTAAPEKHQAVALRVTSNAAFYRCGIISHQDTLYAHSLRQFYHECTIQGTIDFIFGNAAAVFQNCKILVRRPVKGQRNMITAQGREDPNQNTGISLQNCTIEAAEEFDLGQRKHFSTYLGRPWRNYSRTVVVNSYLGDLIHPRGWFEWDRYSSLGTVEYIEYRNSGPGADTRRRISWGGYRKNCSEDVVKQFRAEEFLHGGDDWLDSTVIPLFGGS